MWRVIMIMKNGHIALQKPIFETPEEAQTYINKFKKVLLEGERIEIVFDIYFCS